MSNKVFIFSLIGFVFGIAVGYLFKKNVKRKKSSDNDSSMRKDWFESQMNQLHYSILSVQQQLNNLSSLLSSKDQADANQAEEFYDTDEIGSGFFEEIDQMFEDNVDKQTMYNFLKQQLQTFSEDANFLWRISKAAHFLSKTKPYRNDPGKLKTILYISHDFASKALLLDEKNPDCHKWYAITIGSLKDFVSIKEKVSCGVEFKKHLDIAMSLKNDDPTLYHLAGRFCLELQSISWMERKLANAFLGAIPSVTYQDALDYFLKAYQLKPKWKENLFFLALTLHSIDSNDFDGKMKKYLTEGLAIPIINEEDELIEENLKTLSHKLSKK